MKNCLYLFLAFLLCISCEEVIDVDLPTSETRLVVDALIGFNENNGDPITVGEIKLTLTAPFFQDEIEPAENATVQIIDEETGQSFSLLENETGVFSSGFPNLEFDRDYTLVINYNGEVYNATNQLNASPVIDDIEQGDGFLFDEEKETEVLISFTDIPNERNHYLFSFGFNNFLVIDDDFFEDSQLTFSYFYEDVEPGDIAAVTLFGIDSNFATYANLALAQSGENGNGPFATPPVTIRGNIVNTTNENNFPFGYFTLSEFDTKLLTIQ
ncbi:MAG: DUF4249 family protein [Flavobacteriaceae bacterium]